MAKSKPIAERFWAKVDKNGPNGCWVWTAATVDGYGTIYTGFRRASGTKILVRAHRWSYENGVGPIPIGLEIDHRCHNHACVNPDHLRPATRKQNGENVGPLSNNKSGYRGVSWSTVGNMWVVYVKHNRRNINGGYYADIEDANRAAIALRNRLFTYNDMDRVPNP